MTDKEILISDLNDISEILNNNGYGGWCATILKAVTMLKEQKAVVRCKDCRWAEVSDNEHTWCGHVDDGFCHNNDWFCADGEREESR